MTQVSIALPVRDGAGTLPTTLRSLLRQTLQDWELFLMDDGSHDGSAAVVAGLDDPRIRWISDGAHRGLATRLNQAMDLARGQYFARMDADDIAYPERLARQVAYLDTHPQIDLLATRALAFRGDGEPIGLLPFRAEHDALCAKPWSAIPMPHPTWCGRLEWFRARRYRVPDAARAEDQELLFRNCTTSRFACLPDVLLGYRQGPYSLSRTLTGRIGRARAYMAFAASEGRHAAAFRAFGLAALKATVDLAAALPGLHALYFVRMGERPTPAQLDEWKALWLGLQG